MSFRFHPTEIEGVTLIETDIYPDHRGFFAEIFKVEAFQRWGLPISFVQDNFSFSVQNVLRGLHYQMEPHAQGKLVVALYGEIFDCAVDIRKGSPTYGKWLGIKLSAREGRLLYIPPGFAHGFCVLSASAVVMYKVTQDYNPQSERGIIWNDPAIGIKWPIESPIVSEKDALLPSLATADNNFTYSFTASRW
ncbi:MAG: dTDP-4-dehydrorhamnose 3,5-epimerase [Syntrophales bacterium]|nr:dTDP-4-dehydrorhamnose 3,5-epimerase [Syntrophales bacterium]